MVSTDLVLKDLGRIKMHWESHDGKLMKINFI